MVHVYRFFVLSVLAGILVGTALGSQSSQEVKKKARPGWLGVAIRDVEDRDVSKLKLQNSDGAYITEVVEESPADSAGLQEGDVVVEFSGRAIYDSDDLSKAVKRTAPGTKSSLVVVRKGQKTTINVVISKLPRKHQPMAFAIPRPHQFHFFSATAVQGLVLMDLNEQLAEYFGAPEKTGVLVKEVEKESVAEKAGFKAGDVLLRIGTRTIDEVGDVARAIERYEDEETVQIEVLRKGTKKSLTLDLSEIDDDWDIDIDPSVGNFYVQPRMRWNEGLKMRIEPIKPELDKLRIEIHDLNKEINREVLKHTRPILKGFNVLTRSVRTV